jgi:hypothetical protein
VNLKTFLRGIRMIYKKSKSDLLNSLTDTIYRQQRAHHNYQEWEESNYDEITQSQDLLDKQIEKLQQQNKKMREALDIASNQLEGMAIALIQHKNNIDVPFLINCYKEFSKDAREVLKECEE